MCRQGVLNRANLVQKLSQALVAIGNVLPRADLSAELYQTEYMESALSRLYAYIILFLQLCVRWYNRSPLGRLWSSIMSPFELDYQELAEQIQLCSKAVDDLANAGARAEIRHIRTVLELHHAQSRERDAKLLEMQKKFDDSMVQLLQVVTSNKTITERMSSDVRGISQTVYRIEFHHIVQFFAPEVLPEAALLKFRSLTRRDSTPSLHSPNDLKVRNMIGDWALAESSSLLIVRVGLRAQKQAKELAMNVIEGLKSSDECVFWNVSLPRTSKSGDSIADLFKGIIFQALQHSDGLFSGFAEQLNLSKINSPHTENEWVDLICLLFSKLPKAFIVIETDVLNKAYSHVPNWSERFCGYLQTIVDRSSAAENLLKLLLVMYGNSYQIEFVEAEECPCYDTATADTSSSAVATRSTSVRAKCQRLDISKAEIANTVLNTSQALCGISGVVSS
jgi:hypothetical protein